MSKLKEFLRYVDAYQRQNAWLGFPMAIAKKFGEDQAGYLAALVAYYGFFSLFPLLLVLVTALGFVLARNPRLQQEILHSVLAKFPIIGNQISVHSLRGSGIGLAIGVVLTLLAGLAVVQALQYGMDQLWRVPMNERSNFLMARLRAVLMLAILGVATLGSIAVSGLNGGRGAVAVALAAASVAASVLLNFAILLVAFRVLTVAKVSWASVVPGAAVAALLLSLLQKLGTYYVAHVLKNASQTYGTFALVIGLLTWLYLGAQITFYAAELNVVRSQHLWPRSLQPPLTDAEERSLARLAEEQQRRPEETIETSINRQPVG